MKLSESFIKRMKSLSGILNEQQLDRDYFNGGSEEMFFTPDVSSIEDIIKTFMDQGIYKFKLDDQKFFQLTDYLKANNIPFQETSQLGSDITVFNPESTNIPASWKR